MTKRLRQEVETQAPSREVEPMPTSASEAMEERTGEEGVEPTEMQTEEQGEVASAEEVAFPCGLVWFQLAQ